MNAPISPLRTYHAGDSEHQEKFVQSIARGLAVIKAFGRGRERLTMAEIAQACEITRAGVRRILLTLEDLGYVRQDGRYFSLTALILDLARGYEPRSTWEAVRPHLQRMSDTLNETVSAGVLEGDDVVYMVRIQSTRIMNVDLGVGSRLPAHQSAMGRVLLAALPPGDLEAYLERASFPRLTRHTLCDKDRLRQEIERVGQRGWCCTRAEIDEALWCVSVPLRDRRDRVIAAIHTSFSTNRASDDLVESRIVPALQAAALEIKIIL